MSDLPSGWEWAELSEVCASIADGDHQPPPQASSGVPFLVIGNMRERRIDFSGCRFVPEDYFRSIKVVRRPRKGDVLYSLVGATYGFAVPVVGDRQFCVQRHIGILRPSQRVSTAFLAYVLNSREVYNQATGCVTGTAQPTVPLSGLRKIRIPLPPREEQDSIVAVIEEQLSRLDTGNDSLQRSAVNLIRVRKSILSAALSGALIGKDSTGWPVRRISEISTIASGQTPRGLEFVDGGAIPFYKVGDMNLSDGESMGRSRGYISTEIAKRFSVRVRPRGTVIFPKRGGAISTNKKRILSVPAAYDLNTMGLIPGPIITSRFLYLWLSSIDLSRLADGSNVPQINNGDLADLELRLPSISEQNSIAASADAAISELDAVEQAIRCAEKGSGRLKSSILAAAFSGKLT